MNENNEIVSDSEDLLGEEFLNEKHSVDLKAVEEEDQKESVLSSDAGHPKSEKKDSSPLFAEFIEKFQKEVTAEGKIRVSIDFMRAALSNSGTPRFKDFWEGRKMCLPLFKENISAKVRSELWSLYIELSSEAKRLKEILDEQSAFAIEQIELAIQGLERDLEHYELVLSHTPADPIDFHSFSLKGKEKLYGTIQRELLFLNALASRVNAMRREVVKTEMRIRIKNKLLERLSLCGDKIFPKRKELIKNLSQEFISDVDKFIAAHFQEEELQTLPLYALRDEIKELQSIAKALTLNTQGFTETRLKLSECWNKIRDREKDRKKEAQQKRQVFKQNFDLVMEEIIPFSSACAEGLSLEECNKRSAEILDFMRTLELGREEVKALRDEIQKSKRIPLERLREVEQERQNKEKEAESLRREKVHLLKEGLSILLSQVDALDYEVLSSKKEEIGSELEQLSLTKAEKQMIDRLFKQLKDALDEKREKALLMLSEDDLKALDQLKAVLQERKLRRQEIKNQLEQYRKMLGGSGFDFEKAMLYREMIEEEKAALEKVNSLIGEIEEKIEQIEG